MARAPLRVEFSVRSIVVLALSIAGALVALWALQRSTRVLGWVAAAAVISALLQPPVAALAPRMRRIPAVLLVGLLTAVALGAVGWLVANDLRAQYDTLADVAPRAAASIERSERFGEAARRFDLSQRTESFFDDLPGRLAGGSGAAAVRSAATRAIATLATAVLALFFVLDGGRLLQAGLEQVRGPTRRARLRRIFLEAYLRCWRYIALMVAKAVLVGAVAYAGLRLASVPAASVIGVCIGAASIVPFLGVAVIGLAVASLIGAEHLSFAWGVGAWILLVGLQWLDALVLRRVIHRRALNIGPVITLGVVYVGWAVYGLGGILVGFPIAVFLAALGDTWLAEADVAELTDGGGDAVSPAP